MSLPDAIHATHALRNEVQLAHWNIDGPHFIALHELLGSVYDELGAGLDALAERHRHLGHFVPADTLKTGVPRVEGSWQTMLKALVKDNQTMLDLLHDLEVAAAANGDPGTADLATERIRAHHEHGWKLSAHLA